ncbi:hypothetical protein [Sphingorhabdus sp.]
MQWTAIGFATLAGFRCSDCTSFRPASRFATVTRHAKAVEFVE